MAQDPAACASSDGSGGVLAAVMGAIGEAADIVGRQVNEWWGDWKYGDYLLEPKAAEAQAEARPTSKGCEAETKGKELTRAEKAAVYEALSKMAPVMTCNESNGLKSVGRINDLYEKDAAGKCVKTETMGIYFPATETLLLTDQAGDLQGIKDIDQSAGGDLQGADQFDVTGEADGVGADGADDHFVDIGRIGGRLEALNNPLNVDDLALKPEEGLGFQDAAL